MVSFNLNICSILCAVVLAGHAGANHIKRHHFTLRNQCRPRLHTSDIGAPTTAVPTTAHTASASRIAATTTKFTHSKSTTTLSQSTHTTAVAVVNTVTTLAHVSTSPSPPNAAESPQVAATQAVVQPLGATYTPNNLKAGIAGGDAYPYMKDHIGWWYDWTPNPSKSGKPVAVPMLWGDGRLDSQDASRLKGFEKLVEDMAVAAPRFVLGFEEPDCPSGEGSADVSLTDGVSKWESLMTPLRNRGTKLGSPAMCKQADETWLAQFAKEIATPWDFTAVHINKNSLDGVKKDIEHYKAYGKPIWVTEFACVDDAGKFDPCTDQDEINNFINGIVDYFEETSDVYAYAYSNGLGLGSVWPLMDGDSLSESGRTYLAAISKYH